MISRSSHDARERFLAFPEGAKGSSSLAKMSLSELFIRPVLQEGESPFIFMKDTPLAVALFVAAYEEGVLPFLGEFNNPEVSSTAARSYKADSVVLDVPGYEALGLESIPELPTSILLTRETIRTAETLPGMARIFLWLPEIGVVASWCHSCGAFHLLEGIHGEIEGGELMLTYRKDSDSSPLRLSSGIAVEEVPAASECRIKDRMSFRSA